MMSDRDRFSDRLIAAEQVDAKRKERYEMAVQQILNRTLTPARRIAYALSAILGLFGAVSFSVQAVTQHMTGEYAMWGRAILGLFAVLFLVFSVFAGRAAIRGTANLRKDVPAIAGIRWGISFLIFVTALFVAGLELKYGSGTWSVFTAIVGLAFLVNGTLILTRNLIQQSELSLREKLLEIELRLAEMNEKLDKGQGSRNGPSR